MKFASMKATAMVAVVLIFMLALTFVAIFTRDIDLVMGLAFIGGLVAGGALIGIGSIDRSDWR